MGFVYIRLIKTVLYYSLEVIHRGRIQKEKKRSIRGSTGFELEAVSIWGLQRRDARWAHRAAPPREETKTAAAIHREQRVVSFIFI